MIVAKLLHYTFIGTHTLGPDVCRSISASMLLDGFYAACAVFVWILHPVSGGDRDDFGNYRTPHEVAVMKPLP